MSVFLAVYSIIFFKIQVPSQNGSFGLNFLYSFGLMVAVSIGGLFLVWKSPNNPLFANVKGSREVAYIFFVTGIMWLSPLIGEMLHRQNSNGLVLGGNGFSDILFSAGFSVLLSSLIYCSIRIFLRKTEAF